MINTGKTPIFTELLALYPSVNTDQFTTIIVTGTLTEEENNDSITGEQSGNSEPDRNGREDEGQPPLDPTGGDQSRDRGRSPAA